MRTSKRASMRSRASIISRMEPLQRSRGRSLPGRKRLTPTQQTLRATHGRWGQTTSVAFSSSEPRSFVSPIARKLHSLPRRTFRKWSTSPMRCRCLRSTILAVSSRQPANRCGSFCRPRSRRAAFFRDGVSQPPPESISRHLSTGRSLRKVSRLDIPPRSLVRWRPASPV